MTIHSAGRSLPGRFSGRAGAQISDSSLRMTDRDLVALLSVAAKVRLLTGADSWRTEGCEAIGLRPMLTSDGPAGVRGTTRDERHPSASLPCPSALGATWDTDLVEKLAAALGAEARSKGVDILLAPTVNLMRSPLGGRGFEFFAEDPVLTARLAVAYVRGVQSAGVGATVKHYVGNDTETERWTYDAQISESVLRELYLVPFEACVKEASAWLVMAAYNKVNGGRMTENVRLLRDVLKNEWGFAGVVTSDWHAARSTHATAVATLDLSMPGPDGPWGELLSEAISERTVSEELLDDKVLRLLRLARRVGALDQTPAPVSSMSPTAGRITANDGVILDGLPPVRHDRPTGWDRPKLVGAGLLREAAAASFVLLKNTGAALPLDRAAVSRIAVVGPNAMSPTIQGGGSAGVTPVSVSTPADALLAALGRRTEVAVAPGCQIWQSLPELSGDLVFDPVTGAPGVRLEFTDGRGSVIAAEHRTSTSLAWWDGVPPGIGWGDPGRIVLTTMFRPAQSGPYLLGAAGVGGLTLTADGVTVIDGVTPVPDDPVEAMTRPGELRAGIWLDANAGTLLRLEFRPAADGAGPLAVRLGVAPAVDDDTLLAEAETAAAGADAAIVVVGSAELTESEGFDRASLALPGRQDDLVRRVAAVNKTTIVVVNSGMPVLMPWANQVAAIVYAWLPGQEFGDALTDVLLGTAEPGGRLPVTLPVAEEDCPVLRAEPDDDGKLRYPEGLLIGYRGYDARGIVPRYPFGHGLGYTTWAYDGIDCPEGVADGQDLEFTVTIRNTGSRAGKEVVQAYLAEPGQLADRGRPARVLAAFSTVRAEPGAVTRVPLRIAARAFARYDEDLASWIWPGGVYAVHVGRSSRDLQLEAAVRSGI